MAEFYGQIRKANLGGGALTLYPPDLSQPRHEHPSGHISVVLAGRFREFGCRGEVEPPAGSATLREAGFGHGVQFGPEGALLLTLPIEADAGLRNRPWCRSLGGSAMRAVVRCALDGRTDEIWDIVGTALAEGPARAVGTAPSWLLRAREALAEDEPVPTIAVLAARLGVHRLHLSRAFKAHFGILPSEFRRRLKLERSVRACAEGLPLAQAAQIGGFADQSHMNRVLKADTGLTPSHLRALLG